MLHREYILSCLSRGLSYLIVLTIELTSLFGPIKANAKSDKRFVECSVDQVMFFGDHAVDLPNGPAVLGYQSHPLRDPEAVVHDYRIEAELENDAISATRKLAGASFIVDLTNGNIRAVAPGQQLFDGEDTKPNTHERVQLFPSKLDDWKSFLAIAIIEKTTGRLRSILHLAPLKNGLRRFEWLDLGGMLFGYC